MLTNQADLRCSADDPSSPSFGLLQSVRWVGPVLHTTSDPSTCTWPVAHRKFRLSKARFVSILYWLQECSLKLTSRWSRLPLDLQLHGEVGIDRLVPGFPHLHRGGFAGTQLRLRVRGAVGEAPDQRYLGSPPMKPRSPSRSCSAMSWAKLRRLQREAWVA
jgi:hypothetical protein